jgi:hypothetical protein
MAKLTKQKMDELGLTAADVSALKDKGYTAIVVYESSQMVLDKWVPCYFGTSPAHKLEHDQQLRLAIAEGRARDPVTFDI